MWLIREEGIAPSKADGTRFIFLLPCQTIERVLGDQTGTLRSIFGPRRTHEGLTRVADMASWEPADDYGTSGCRLDAPGCRP